MINSVERFYSICCSHVTLCTFTQALYKYLVRVTTTDIGQRQHCFFVVLVVVVVLLYAGHLLLLAHCIGASIVLLWRLSSSSVTLHGGPAGGFTRAGQVMTSCRLQSSYSSTVTLQGGPVVLRPVRAMPCYNWKGDWFLLQFRNYHSVLYASTVQCLSYSLY